MAQRADAPATYLITGAAGLLGGAAARRILAESGRVVGLDVDWGRQGSEPWDRDVERVVGDIRDTELVRRIIQQDHVTRVIHLAAQTLVGPALYDPVDTFRHNIEGTWSVLEACRLAGTVEAIVVASSDKAYGDWSGRPYREDMALRAHHPYDVSKAATDLLSRSYALTYDLPIGITRCGNLYGGGDLNWSRIVPGTIRSVLEGKRPVIRSDGTLVRDYLHVDDAASAVLQLSQVLRVRSDLRGEAFNFATRTRLTVTEMVDAILRHMDSNLRPIIEGRQVQEIPEQRLSTSKARKLLGWKPRVTLDAGIAEAVAWYRVHLSSTQ